MLKNKPISSGIAARRLQNGPHVPADIEDADDYNAVGQNPIADE